mgnify:CR=1 FL=1
MALCGHWIGSHKTPSLMDVKSIELNTPNTENLKDRSSMHMIDAIAGTWLNYSSGKAFEFEVEINPRAKKRSKVRRLPNQFGWEEEYKIYSFDKRNRILRLKSTMRVCRRCLDYSNHFELKFNKSHNSLEITKIKHENGKRINWSEKYESSVYHRDEE